MSTANVLSRCSDEEVRKMLRERKQRKRTSCYPCRTRKVKCDKSLPCQNCSKRNYPELCSFTGGPEDPMPEQDHPSRQHLPRQRRLGSHSQATRSSPGLVASQHVASLQDGFTTTATNGRAASASSMGDGDFDRANATEEQREPFLGSNSIPAFLVDQPSSSNSTQKTPSQNVQDAILPILGLQNSRSTYPFLLTSRTSLESLHSQIHQVLPVNSKIIRLFQYYRTEAHPFSPIIPQIDDFEFELCAYLESRGQRSSSSQNQDHQESAPWKSISWVGLLLAVLASGSQYSDSLSQERLENAQLYARYSFQCLRMANFLIRPSILCVQILLILGNVLQNDMKPEAAWILLGTTARMAQSLGLHKEQGLASSQRRGLWLALVWQDSLLSLCYDRPPVTTPSTQQYPVADKISYVEAMYCLCDRTLRSISSNAQCTTPNFPIIFEHVAGIEEICLKYNENLDRIAPRLSIQQRCESYALKLHISFVVAWLCRPALRNYHSPEPKTEVQLQLIEKFHSNLLTCTRAFVLLYSLRAIASRSWAIIHNGLSSALLLGLFGATATNPEVRQLQGKIIEIFHTDESEGGHDQARVTDFGLSRAHTRAVNVLNSLYTDHAKTPSRCSVAANSRPFQEEVNSLDQHNAIAAQSQSAEMYDYGDIVPPGSVNYLENVSMSPLDMFESIIWEPMELGEPTFDSNTLTSDLWSF